MKKEICLLSSFKREENDYYLFHFNGVYMGHNIKGIRIYKSSKNPQFVRRCQYLLLVELCGQVFDDFLLTRLIRYRPLGKI